MAKTSLRARQIKPSKKYKSKKNANKKTLLKKTKSKKYSNKKKTSLSKGENKISVPYVRFVGLSLGGGKSERTSITILDYYTQQKKLVVSRLFDRLYSDGVISSDLKLYETIREYETNLQILAIDVPLSEPKCFRCELKCPGYESCEEPEILWMWKQFKNDLKINKNHKLFTPYTRRCAEMHWSKELEGSWSLGDALGANQAPLLARAKFLLRRLEEVHDLKVIEVIPRLSLLRWSYKHKLLKYMVSDVRSSTKGIESREYVISKLIEELGLFVYDQDRTLYCDSLVSFDSLLAALTAFWKFQNRCEAQPKSFPRTEHWIDVPKF